MQKIINNFKPLSGKHCITCSIRQVLKYFGQNFSEEMLFGLASALNFMYFDYKTMQFPFIGGRNKIIEFENNLAAALNIKIKINKTSSAQKALSSLKEELNNNKPVMLYVDMGELSYLGLPAGSHFGGHAIVIFGIDEENDIAYISDRDGKNKKITMHKNENPEDFHKVPLFEVVKARNSKAKPFPAENKWLEFDLGNIKPITPEMLKKAIRINCNSLLNPPIKNLGLKAIKLFSEKLHTDWLKFDIDKLRTAAINSFVMINEVGGNGGGIFRKMYSDFLKEGVSLGLPVEIKKLSIKLKAIGEKWDEAGHKLYSIYEKVKKEALNDIAENIADLYREEMQLFCELEKVVG